MPNYVKYSTSIPSGSLLKGTVALGVTTASIAGPTSTTNWYAGITPASGKYVIYKTAATGDPDIFCPQTNQELFNFVLMQGGSASNITSVSASLAWIGTQSNLMAANIEYENIVTSGSVLNLDAGFVGSYPTTASNWYDISGNANNCTLVNGPTYTTSGSGGIKFDAIDDYATIPDSNSLDLTELTISLWFNRGSILTLTNSDGENFFLKGVSTNDEYCPAVTLLGPTGGGRYAWVSQPLGVSYAYIQPPSQVLFANQWYNLVFTHVSTNTPIPYLNGVKQTDWTVSNPTNPLLPNTWGATICGDQYRFTKRATFNGIMSIVQLYNRALSETEVLQNWNSLKGRFGL
jgi:hypothetical protein